MRYEVAVEIAAAPERVWEVLTDVAGWPRWTESMTAVRRLDEGPLAVDSEARVEQPRLTAAVWKVSELEPGRSFEWRSENAGFTTTGSHRLEPTGSGGTRVVLGVRQEGFLAPLLGLLYGRLTRRYVDQEAAGLKRFCEGNG
ncbi:SRPBCC family protein [Kitasatospora cinereorecta]|uniref:SRPBCC family protein n=1 Tax=Kitasatospora cinereorecta TaxID=285560 RepID=A0ABW0VG21_9ACTN